MLLHGRNGTDRGPLATLEPHLANDAAKVSGDQRAVYATTDVDVALLYAVFNRTGLSTRFDSYVVGHQRMRDGLHLKLSDNLYEVALREPEALWSDGFVYVVDRAGFRGQPGDGPEFHSAGWVSVRRVVRVPASWGRGFFGVNDPDHPGAIVPYARSDQGRLADHIARLGLSPDESLPHAGQGALASPRSKRVRQARTSSSWQAG